MKAITIHEFDAVIAGGTRVPGTDGVHGVPDPVFDWLDRECLRGSESDAPVWLRPARRNGKRAIQVMNFVGVVCLPGGFQIEVLPKIGKIGASVGQCRDLLLDMLASLDGFRHIRMDDASLRTAQVSFLEIFITGFLHAVGHVVKRGLRSDYATKQDNLFALRGKLLVAMHLRANRFRADRFYTEHDEFTTNRAENRLLHSALHRVAGIATSAENQKLAREYLFVFADIPVSRATSMDFQHVKSDRGMVHYAEALAWARLILEDQSPLTGMGNHRAPSMLFPMDALFEAFVARHVAKQLTRTMNLKSQCSSNHLVRHQNKNWFRLKPDLMVQEAGRNALVLDTKWKLLDRSMANGTDKYGLSQADFYQLQAYGQSYLDGSGDVVLVYPRTTAFDQPLPPFEFAAMPSLRLWVLPFCLATRKLLVPAEAPFRDTFS